MHKEVRRYCQKIKAEHPLFFTNADVLDCGSLDINGNNRYLFENSRYTGIDIVQGKNVDIISRIHEFDTPLVYDCVISTEMLEHDENYALSLNTMFNCTVPGGLLLITAAGQGRPEHGTFENKPQDSPLTRNYYQNVDVLMLLCGLDLTQFSWFNITYVKTDIQFAGIKKQLP